MRKVIAFLSSMTLDGVAENPEYPDEPAVPDDPRPNPLWSPRMSSIDTLLLGRITYLKWAGFWPRQKNIPANPRFVKEFSEFADRAEKVVFSRSLPSVGWSNSRIARGNPREEIAQIRERSGGDLALAGGPRLIQSFLDEDLVDELLINLAPSLVGGGKPWFRVRPDPDHESDVIPLGAVGRHDFRPVEAKVFEDGSVYLHYNRVR